MIHFPLYVYQTKLYSSRGILAGMDRLSFEARAAQRRHFASSAPLTSRALALH